MLLHGRPLRWATVFTLKFYMGGVMKDMVCAQHHDIDERMVALCGAGPVAAGVRYHFATGGARVRAQLGLQAADSLGLGKDVALACACGAELLHNASLVHDDLQDHDAMRRGHPAVWKQFGAAAAISIGDLMISAAYAALASHPDPARAIRLAHEALARTARGQARDLMRSRASVEDYRAMVADKTGTLIALPVRLALAACDARGDASAVACGDALAFAYQALDDIADCDADRASGRINLCTLLTPTDAGVARAKAVAQDALRVARAHADAMPDLSGQPFRKLADRMETRLMEDANAA